MDTENKTNNTTETEVLNDEKLENVSGGRKERENSFSDLEKKHEPYKAEIGGLKESWKTT